MAAKETPDRVVDPSDKDHPVGTGVGAVAGAATGATLGTIGGPWHRVERALPGDADGDGR